jgi:hypothetical protein
VKVINNKTKNYKTIHFGAAGMSDYTKHKDPKRKQRYIARHKPRENWNDIASAGFWSRWLLWNRATLRDSKKNISDRFSVQFI